MRLAVLALLIALVPAPALAARAWQEPVRLSGLGTAGEGQGALGPDGTLVTAWTETSATGRQVVAKSGTRPAVGLGPASFLSVPFVAAGPRGDAAVVWGVGSGSEERTLVAFASADGTFSAPVEVGAGHPAGLRGNPAGDMAVILGQVVAPFRSSPAIHRTSPPMAVSYATAWRPAGGRFGAPVDVVAGPGLFIRSAVGPSGETLIAYQDANGALRVASRRQGGPLEPGVAVSPAGQIVHYPGDVAVDAGGRALATWTDGQDRLTAAVRGAEGTWTPATGLTGTSTYGPVAGTSDAGDAVVAWAASTPIGNGTVQVATGSLSDGIFAPPVGLGGAAGQSSPSLVTEPDGTTLIATEEPTPQGARIRAARREGTSPFSASQAVACPDGSGSTSALGVDSSGSAALMFKRRDSVYLVRDAPVGTAQPDRSCDVSGPFPLYSPTPVVAGEPVTIDVAGRRRPLEPVLRVMWDMDADGRYEEDTGATTALRHVFPRPGRRAWNLRTAQGSGFQAGVTNDRETVDVFARAALRAPRQRRAAVVRRGLRVVANAFTAVDRVRVRIRVRAGGRLVGSRAVRLGAAPDAVRIRLHPRALRHRRRAALRVTLIQAGTRRAKAGAVVSR